MSAALSIAQFGEWTTPELALLWQLYQSKEGLQMLSSKAYLQSLKFNRAQVRSLQKVLRSNVSAHERAVRDTLMRAILELDSFTLRQIGDAVSHLKFHASNPSPADPLRYRILLLRQELELKGERMTVRQVAEHLQMAHYSTPEDGFASLRRLCKSLHFPLLVKRRKRRVIHREKS